MSIGISVFVLWNVFRNLRKFFDVFLQRTPATFDLPAFENAVKSIPQVVGVHDTHSWSIDGEKHVLTTHIVVPTSTTADEAALIKTRVIALIGDDAF